MLNNTQKRFISQLCKDLPTRSAGKRGTKPIKKERLIKEYFKLVKYGLGWRQIRFASTVRSYVAECQRRGLLKKMMFEMSGENLQKRNKASITDACELLSWRVSKEVAYSGKQHAVTAKISLELTDEYKIRDIRFAYGYHHDKYEWERMLEHKHSLPYSWYMDKGYDDIKMRIWYRKLNCQIRTPPKKYKHRHVREARQQWGTKENRIRIRIEQFFSWIQSFRKVRERRERHDALFHANVYLAITYYLYFRKT
jgi:hypothetical protein